MVAGIELGSFTHAAAQLCRSQSAISMQLKKLEQQAGTPLFVRQGRGLVPTEAGETLAAYARKIIALNDEASLALGANVTAATVRLGLPQDFFEDVMPATLRHFSGENPQVHVEVRAGPNYRLSDDIQSSRLDGAIAFFAAGANGQGELLGTLPAQWLAHKSYRLEDADDRVPLVLFEHPCLFRQAAFAALEANSKRWTLAVTTPSLPGIWGALRSHLGVAVRTAHALPKDIVCLGTDAGLPPLPAVEVRLLRAGNASAAASQLCEILREETIKLLQLS